MAVRVTSPVQSVPASEVCLLRPAKVTVTPLIVSTPPSERVPVKVTWYGSVTAPVAMSASTWAIAASRSAPVNPTT